jgi:hypothetical protein
MRAEQSLTDWTAGLKETFQPCCINPCAKHWPASRWPWLRPKAAACCRWAASGQQICDADVVRAELPGSKEQRVELAR